VASSEIIKSPASVDFVSVPSNTSEPSIMETNPSAEAAFESLVVNVRVSPTSYVVPASSITTSLTEPGIIF